MKYKHLRIPTLLFIIFALLFNFESVCASEENVKELSSDESTLKHQILQYILPKIANNESALAVASKRAKNAHDNKEYVKWKQAVAEKQLYGLSRPQFALLNGVNQETIRAKAKLALTKATVEDIHITQSSSGQKLIEVKTDMGGVTGREGYISGEGTAERDTTKFLVDINYDSVEKEVKEKGLKGYTSDDVEVVHTLPAN